MQFMFLLMIIIIIAVIVTNITDNENRFNRYKGISEREIMKLSPFEFENFICALLLKIGFKSANCTSRTNDGGKDIVAIDAHGKLVYVECKKYKRTAGIGRPYIQKLHSAMVHDKADYAIFVTTSYFNKNAIKYAKDINIQLIDMNGILQLIK